MCTRCFDGILFFFFTSTVNRDYAWHLNMDTFINTSAQSWQFTSGQATSIFLLDGDPGTFCLWALSAISLVLDLGHLIFSFQCFTTTWLIDRSSCPSLPISESLCHLRFIKTKTALSRIWIHVTGSISEDDNNYTKRSLTIKYLLNNTYFDVLVKAWRQLHKNAACNIEQDLTKHQLYGHPPPVSKTIKVRWIRHAGNYWRSRDELISDVLLWTPSDGLAKVERLARTYIQELCDDTDVALKTC